jgi:hypothetical protein
MRCSTKLALFALPLLVAACGPTKRVVEHLPTPPERLICEPAGTRPAIPPEHQIDWSQVRTVDAARLQHQRFVETIRVREGTVAGYVLKLEGKLFTCWNNMTWRREYEAGIAR